jgi:hypothetical protein
MTPPYPEFPGSSPYWFDVAIFGIDRKHGYEASYPTKQRRRVLAEQNRHLESWCSYLEGKEIFSMRPAFHRPVRLLLFLQNGKTKYPFFRK